VTLASQIVRGAMDALVNLDTAAARRIISLDAEVDEYNRVIITASAKRCRTNPISCSPP